MVGVGGGIAAYKACELVRRLLDVGFEVQVVPTRAALEFVGRPTWEALTGRPAPSEVWERVHEVSHVAHGQRASALIVAPATADLLARAAGGNADDLLTTTLLATRGPVIFAPAMHTEMWENPATRHNVAVLRERGHVVVEPACGPLAGGDVGVGRLPEPQSLASIVEAAALRSDFPEASQGDSQSVVRLDLAGRRVLVSAGGTREPLDPVRYLGNRSSGRQGWALAASAVARGAEVTVIAANVGLADPAGTRLVRVESAAEMREAVMAEAEQSDVIVMAAAVADFRPLQTADRKIKKKSAQAGSGVGEFSLELVETEDILAGLGRLRTHLGDRMPLLVGFAAETVSDDVELEILAGEKLRQKSADLIVANRVGHDLGFESTENEALIITADGPSNKVGPASKTQVANAVWDAVATKLKTKRTAGALADGDAAGNLTGD